MMSEMEIVALKRACQTRLTETRNELKHSGVVIHEINDKGPIRNHKHLRDREVTLRANITTLNWVLGIEDEEDL